MTLTVRPMTEQDVPACAAILNDIIARGGSTAHEDPYDEKGFSQYYLHDPAAVNVVLSGDRVVGFQAVFDVGEGVYSVGSFTDRRSPVRGAGVALFSKTKEDCRALGGQSIIAKITSDNVGGLAFYSKLGFEPDAVWPDEFTRKNGTTVDRIVKRYRL